MLLFQRRNAMDQAVPTETKPGVKGTSRRHFSILKGVLLFILLLGAVVYLTSRWTYGRGFDKLADQGKVKLELYITYLSGVLEKYESLPELLATDRLLVATLQDPGDYHQVETLNRYLEAINSISDTADIYLMDKNGLTIAASNWKDNNPFIGNNFSYRPYFQEAMKGRLGRYYALGTTSSKRGYYFAFPVRDKIRILGVVAVKVNIDTVERNWAHRDESYLISDPDGVIFITSTPEWRYRTIDPLEPAVQKKIIESKRYPNTRFEALSTDRGVIEKSRQIIRLTPPQESEPKTYLRQFHFMPEAQWNVNILTDIQSLKRDILINNILACSGLFLAFFLLLLFSQRQHRLRELNRIEEAARRNLEEANEQLESRVLDRTRELTETNLLLRKEIADRQKTEIALKKTRSELIHAAKLAALGQMSAGINHEINQPLAAIRSYAENGCQLLDKGRLADTRWNLEQIGELTERMAQIGNQLKLFSRKSSGQMTVVPVHGVMEGTLEILGPAIKKSGVTVQVRIVPEDLRVKANNVLLQQVLVNVISNGIQAMEEGDRKEITIEAKLEAAMVTIVFEDCGAGIPPEHLPHIFEPFYTTKKSGQGLGLGLTISDRILLDMNGKITAVNTRRGARFQITLEKA
jgi:two-component system C4-dicarboxylate transport sensor histidine kinase DctB